MQERRPSGSFALAGGERCYGRGVLCAGMRRRELIALKAAPDPFIWSLEDLNGGGWGGFSRLQPNPASSPSLKYLLTGRLAFGLSQVSAETGHHFLG